MPFLESALQDRVLFPVVLIGARHNHGARSDVGVIGDQDTAFTGIQQLVGLERKTADLAYGTDLLAMPLSSQRMRGVFDNRNACGIGHGHDRIHV